MYYLDMNERMAKIFQILVVGYPIFFIILLIIISDSKGSGINMWKASDIFFYGEHVGLYFRNEIPFFSLVTAFALFAIRYVLVGKTYQD